jgi:hypothetical protein
MYVPTHPKTQKACVYCETRVTVKCEVCLCRGRGDRVRPASGSAVNETARAGYPVTARVTNLLDAPRCPHHTVAWLVRKRMLPTVSLICYLKIGVVCCVLEIA